jgi:hypothetical protein
VVLQRVLDIEQSRMTQTTTATTARKVLSISMKRELFDEIAAHCESKDIPVSVFMREAAKYQIQQGKSL